MYNFRLHFILANSSTLGIHDTTWEFIDESDKIDVILRPLDSEKKINDAKELVLSGKSFDSVEEALHAGNRYRDALQATLIYFHHGANFGDDKSKGGFSNYVKDKFKAETGIVLLDDCIGISVYDIDYPTCFTQTSSPTLGLVLDEKQFSRILTERLQVAGGYTSKERLAIKLYNDSFFAESCETRFLLLIMAIEALLEPQDRQDLAINIVQTFITEIRGHSTLPEFEKNSLVGSLTWLQKESISKTGRDLAIRYLGEKEYMNKKADEFFTYCYGIRSNLVHGSDRDNSHEKLGSVAAVLEGFVANILDGIITLKVNRGANRLPETD